MVLNKLLTQPTDGDVEQVGIENEFFLHKPLANIAEIID
jgi:hypothetical protein